MNKIMLQEVIENKIYMIRGQKVMLDSDLALLYGVTTFNLNKSVKRNLGRFPYDFMFRLNLAEYSSLTFQIGISKKGRGGRRHLPYVFTEQGVSMLSSVLNSERAIRINIAIMRVFVRIKETLAAHKELASKLRELENKISKHDEDILTIFEAIRQLMAPPPEPPRRKIGFRVE